MRIILTVREQCTVHEIPVLEEGTLQSHHAPTLHAQHRVAPRHRTRSFHIAQGDVHTTDIAHATINDNNLAVIPVVHLTCK